MYLTCITHLSKIFNFLSSGNYSSLDVNFFRFSFSLGGGEGDNRREPQAEQPRPLGVILKQAESAMSALRHPDPKDPGAYLQILRFKNILLGEIQRLYVELGSYEEYELARKTREELLKILEENGRSP